MLKKRIMPTLLFKDFGLVKGKTFDSWRRVGSAMQTVKVYNMREVDELIFLDIKASEDSRRPDFTLIDELADECFMPLTVGGGIKSVNDAGELLKVGADKVSINSAFVENPDLALDVSRRYGSQCLVVSIDYKRINNKLRVMTHSGKRMTNYDPLLLAELAEKKGAGEILLTSVDHDGMMEGYDVDVVKQVCEKVNIPVIASGGAGSYEHMVDVLKIGNASSVAAASLFHFTEQTPLEAKKYLKQKQINVRI